MWTFCLSCESPLPHDFSHVDTGKGNYVSALFVDYNSAFNTIVSSRLMFKLLDQGLGLQMQLGLQVPDQ